MQMFEMDLNRVLDIATHRWHRKSTLTIVLLATVVIILLGDIRTPVVDRPRIFMAAALLLAISVIWWFSNRIPKPRRGTIGFVLAISTGNSQGERRLRSDFVEELKPLLQRVGRLNGGARFTCIELPARRAADVKAAEDAVRVLQKAEAVFGIFGRARTRKEGGKDYHVLDLFASVQHRPVSQDVSEALGREMAELLPRRWILPVDNELSSVQLTSELIAAVSRYVIAMAAGVSGEFDAAIHLFADAEGCLPTAATDPLVGKVRERVPVHLRAMRILRMVRVHKQWLRERQPELLAAAEAWADEILMQYPGDYNATLEKAICVFARKRDVGQAKALLLGCQHVRDRLWRYGIAFLLAYEGDLDAAWPYYRQAFALEEESDSPIEVEEFMDWVLQTEPEKIQLYYCLGLINLKVKKDGTRAMEDFTSFLAGCRGGEYPKQCALAAKYIDDLRAGETATGGRGSTD